MKIAIIHTPNLEKKIKTTYTLDLSYNNIRMNAPLVYVNIDQGILKKINFYPQILFFWRVI